MDIYFLHSLGKMHSRCFGIMGGHGNLAFTNLVVRLSVELGYVFLSLKL
jgi:hypothetical protein